MRSITKSTTTKPLERAWAEELVRTAEEQFNRRDVAAIVRGYARDATLEMCSEGLHETYSGADAIGHAWRVVFDVFPKMQLRKQLVCVDGERGTLVNEWHGSVDGRSRAYGLDLWWIDDDRSITRHEVISFGKLARPRSLAGALRWLAIHPTSMLRLLRGLR